MHVRAFSFLSLCARNSLTFAALRPGDGLGPRCQYYRSPSAGYVTKFQSTHPRGVRPTSLNAMISHAVVSIHAPAWGATCWARYRGKKRAGFNPRTRVGCDFEREVKMELLSLFQSTHPRGVRPVGLGIAAKKELVSNHAPPRGATSNER